jgi:hypothetical protein
MYEKVLAEDMGHRICLIIGAGCTVADTTNRPQKNRPPLDKEFFSIAHKTNPDRVDKIKSYVKLVYESDILIPENDSLEGVMATIYTDIFNPNLKDKAIETFRTLISLFNRRLADTTNQLPATRGRYLYRIISHFLITGVQPSDITIITFNQDIQIEKILEKLQNTKKHNSIGKIFNFPFCYCIDFDSTTTPSSRTEIFTKGDINSKGIELLKLHGSLNWYSIHTSQNISPSAMFRPDRRIHATHRRRISTQLRYTGGVRRQHTLPVIIPPINHKSAILHNSIEPLWRRAEKTLKKADEVLIFGYSCPPTDFESSNLIKRSLRNGVHEALWVIDPNPNVLTRYIELVKPDQITYYPSAKDYLERRR